MGLLRMPPQAFAWGFAVLALLALGAASGAADEAKIEVLLIGASNSPKDKEALRKEKAAVGSLQKFVKDETGLENKVTHETSWAELADKLAKGKLHLGVFEGHEFGWAREKHPGLKPLAVAVNADRYPIACVVVKRDNPAKDFAGLQGQSISLPAAGPYYLDLFVQRQSDARSKKPGAFFSKTTLQQNVEDALDDVVDGVVQATVVDRAALDAYKRRKPGRFNRLREVARSQPFPPTVVAYHGNALDEALRRRFRDGLLGAARKEKGRMMLTLFRVSGFEAIPADLETVLASTRKAYPPPRAGRK